MGIRRTQFVGLSPEAECFLEVNAEKIPIEKCPHCGEPIRWKRKSVMWKNEAASGMFDDGPLLQQYTLINGEKVREEIQATPWSSGPVIFLKLIDEEGKSLFQWSEEEINAA